MSRWAVIEIEIYSHLARNIYQHKKLIITSHNAGSKLATLAKQSNACLLNMYATNELTNSITSA